MASLLFSETIIYYSQALLVRLTSGSSVIRVNFHSLQKQFNASEWVSLIDMDDAEELSDTEKMILLDCTKTPLLNSLATLSNDPLVVAVLCVCREVTEEELKISAEELMSGEYPSIIFLQDKATDVAELKQLLLLNPQEVECSISEGQTLSPIVQDQARKRSSESSFSSGLEAHAGQGKSKIRESVIHDILDNLLFVKEQEDDLVPLVLCRHPQTITLIINFIYLRVDSQVRKKKDSSRSSLNQIVKYLKSKVIFESHVQVDWPIYLVIFLEVLLLYDSSKENQATEAIDYILTRFFKLNPEVIAYSIRRFEELTQNKVFGFRKLGNPKSELIDLFSIQYTQSQKTGNKFYNTKPIYKQQDLENKLLWYNVLMLCNQSFKIPGHSKWKEHLIKHIDYDQLSIYDSSNLNTIWESGIQFGIKLDLSFGKRFLLSYIVSWISSNVKTYTFQNFNIILDFILKYQYNTMEIADFLSYYSHFISQYSKSDKHYLNSLIENNPKASVEMMCLTLSKLATLVCTAVRDSEEKSSQCEVCKKHWIDILKILLSSIINYNLNIAHNPRDFAVVLRCFYDIVKIPTAPEALVKPWIKEHKKEVVVMITTHFIRIDIETFHEILIKFPVAVLSKIAIFDYFTKYQPSKNMDLKDHVWEDLLTIIFKVKDPPKSIFQTFEKIFMQYLQRNRGFEFICNCLEFDLPAYGLEYKSTDKEEKLISNFMLSIESKCKCELRLIMHNNLVYILNYIPKQRFPSLLQVLIMDSLCRAIVPEQSLLSNPNKNSFWRILFDACLRKCMADKIKEVHGKEERRDIQSISMEQFVECTLDCYKSLDRICEGISTYTEIDQINKNISLKCLDFARVYTDINMFPPLAAQIKGDLKLPNLALTNILITDKVNIAEGLCTRINAICKEYNPQAFIKINANYTSPLLDKLPIPTNLFEVLRFLYLLCRVPLPPILLTIARFSIITNVLKICSEIYHCLNIDQAGFFFQNIPISFEIIKLQRHLIKYFETIPFNECYDPNLNVFITSCTPMKESVHLIAQQFYSRQLCKSQLLTLKEKLLMFNGTLNLYGELEPIDINVLSSQISEFEDKQKEIKRLLFFNTEVGASTSNSLLVFMRSFSVNIPILLDEYVTSVLSSFDYSSTDSNTIEITLDQLTTKYSYIVGELSLLSRDVFEFISFFSRNNNLLFLSLLRQLTSHKLSQLSTSSGQHFDIKQFIQCVHETYQHMHSMCIGDSSYTHVQSFFTHSSIRSTDLKNIVDNLSEFPKFSLILRDGFPCLCLFELLAISNYIHSIVELCENFDLQVCISSFDFQSLQRHSYNLRDSKYCERVNILLANQLMRDISQLTSSMPLDRMKLMATVAKCNEILLVFNELHFMNGRTDLEMLLTKILSDPQLEEHHLLISTNLLPVYDCLTPLFDKHLHFAELVTLYSNLPINNEEEIGVKLEQLMTNINVVRLCFQHVNAF